MKYAETKLGTLFRLMAESRRFCDIKILDQVNDVDTARSIQFSATAFEIPNVGIVIGYRGTDSSLVGWKEASEGFLGKLRNALEEARLSSARYGNIVFDRSEVQAGETWDRYEQSVLLSLADDVKITIRGDEVKMIVSKTF